MATKKFSNFEYASLSDTGSFTTAGLHRYDAFETSHGHTFVVVSNDRDDEQQADLCRIVIERIKYYLENEPDESKEVVHGNALTYAGGYLFQMGQKDPTVRVGKISCLCALFSEEKIHYSWIGHVDLFLFTGKRMYLLSWKDLEGEMEAVAGKDECGNNDKNAFLGSKAIVVPFSGSSDVEPVNGDILILASGGVCRRLHTKDTRKVLQDSMPLQTKAARILRHSDSVADQCPASIVLLRFHDLKNTERSFGTGQVASKPESSKQRNEQDMAKDKPCSKTSGKTIPRLIKAIFGVIGLLVVGYFIYDLLIYDPHPPVPLPETTSVALTDTGEHVKAEDQDGAQPADETPVLPDDLTYIVRSGDTWGRIYVQYGVCSWFIINHRPNTGRFGREGSLIAGESLRIPVKYSGKAEYNPNYYQEFATEKVGNRCEHAGPELLRAFEEKTAQ